MARQQRITAADLGVMLGQALGEGIAEGLAPALAKVRAELAPLETELIEMLRSEAQAALALAPQEVETILREGVRYCEEPGCERRAIARSLCRRHYARKVYQERKARQSPEGTISIRRPSRPAAPRGEDAVDKKVLAPVAPIVRRKKSDLEEAAAEKSPAVPTAARLSVVPPAAQPTSTSVAENVARFFGVTK